MKRDLLSAKKVQGAKPAVKDYQLADGAGLYLRVRQTGAKVWLIRKMIRGKAISQTLGAYPQMSLADARKHRGTNGGGKGVGFADLLWSYHEGRSPQLKPSSLSSAVIFGRP